MQLLFDARDGAGIMYFRLLMSVEGVQDWSASGSDGPHSPFSLIKRSSYFMK